MRRWGPRHCRMANALALKRSRLTLGVALHACSILTEPGDAPQGSVACARDAPGDPAAGSSAAAAAAATAASTAAPEARQPADVPAASTNKLVAGSPRDVGALNAAAGSSGPATPSTDAASAASNSTGGAAASAADRQRPASDGSPAVSLANSGSSSDLQQVAQQQVAQQQPQPQALKQQLAQRRHEAPLPAEPLQQPLPRGPAVDISTLVHRVKQRPLTGQVRKPGLPSRHVRCACPCRSCCHHVPRREPRA